MHEPQLIGIRITGFIPNTAVFGPTNFIGTIATTTTTTTARMKISDSRFLEFSRDF